MLDRNSIPWSDPPGETLLGWLDQRVKDSPERTYLSDEERVYTFREIAWASDAIASHLTKCGVRLGDRVATLLHNGAVSMAAVLAIAKCGAVWVPVNVQQRGASLCYQLEHCAPAAVIVESELAQVVTESGGLPSHVPLVTRVELDRAAFSGERFERARPAPGDLFAISYTSGTTGPPKGVRVTFRMLEYSARGAILTSMARDGDVFFVWEPLYHIGGAQLIAIPLLMEVKLAVVPRFSASRFWEQVSVCGATHIHYLGGIAQILLRTPHSDFETKHRVRVAWGAGLPAAEWAPFEQRFGVKVVECYGMTEASSFTTCNLLAVPGSVGQAVPWLSFRICDEQGRDAACGQTGEIVVAERMPGALFDGYYRDPEATARALSAGELRTGDLGRADAQANLFFVGRATDSLRIRGENVSAWEVEHVVKGHAAIEDAAVVGVAADVGEQEAKLFVKLRPGAELSADELASWLQPRLGKHQRPRYVVFVEDFQYTPSQRLIKHTLPRDIAKCYDMTRRAILAQGN